MAPFDVCSTKKTTTLAYGLLAEVLGEERYRSLCMYISAEHVLDSGLDTNPLRIVIVKGID